MKTYLKLAVAIGVAGWFFWQLNVEAAQHEKYFNQVVMPRYKKDVDQYFKDKRAAEALAERAAESLDLVNSY